MIRLTRRYRFSASHRLHTDRLSESENQELYGKCSNPHGHGHDYLLAVSLRGPIDPVSGRAADVAALDGLVRDRVLAAFDHSDLNVEIPALIPTTENLALEIRDRLRRHWAAAFPGDWPKLDKIRIAETRKNAFEVNNEEQ
jgi:6-pyruvoyltetrahydropterin/6-carboxytetrahydropterin synthase